MHINQKNNFKMQKEQILEEFGEVLMKSVREWVISNFERDLAGASKQTPKFFETLSVEQKDEIRTLVYETIDSTIHHFLFMLEHDTEDDHFDLIYKENEINCLSLRDISDGLGGEPYTEEGWIQKFSKYPELNFSPYEDKSTPEENLVSVYKNNPTEGKRIFIRILSNQKDFEAFKLNLQTVPREIIERLMEMTLEKSNFHQRECEEIIHILNKNKDVISYS